MYRRFLIVAVAAALAVVAVGYGVKSTEAAAVANAGGPYSGTVGVPVQFSAGNSTGAVSYSWSFGDGTTDTGIAPVHTYSAAGTYTVQLTAIDQFGQGTVAVTTATISGTTTTTSTVSVFPAPQCPFGGVLLDGGFYCVGSPLVTTSPILTMWPFTTTPQIVTTSTLCPFLATAQFQSCLVPVTTGNVLNAYAANP